MKNHKTLPETPPRDFKGMWIPKEIWLNNKLSIQEKVILAEIHSLDGEDGCYASNEYFEKFFGLRKRVIQLHISRLKNLGFIREESFDGRKRILKTTHEIFYTADVQYNAPLRCNKMHVSLIGDSIERENKEERKVYKKERNKEKAPPTPKGDMVRFGRFVILKKEEYEELCKQLTKKLVDNLIEEINDYLASTGKNPYKDYAATIRNWARRRSNQKGASTPGSEINSFFEAFKARFKAHPNIVIGNNYVEFLLGASGSEYISVGDHGFKERVLNRLRKWGKSTEGLD